MATLGRSRCSHCRKPLRGSKARSLPSGRTVCPSCYRRLAEFSGAGAAMLGGDDVVGAISTGIAAGGYAGAFSGEAAASEARAAKLAATQGFWRRLWVRVIG